MYQEAPQLTAEIVRKISNPNYETYHMMEVIKKRKFDPTFEVEKVETNTFDGFQELLMSIRRLNQK